MGSEMCIRDRCTSGALLHILGPCGHKVITEQPELCARNCHYPPPVDATRPNSMFPSPRTADRAFVCPICADEIATRVTRTCVAADRHRIHQTGHLIQGPTPKEWDEHASEEREVRLKRRIVDETLSLGRKCWAVIGEPAVQDSSTPGALQGKEPSSLSEKSVEKKIARLPRQLSLHKIVRQTSTEQQTPESSRETGRSWRERSRIPKLVRSRPFNARRG